MLAFARKSLETDKKGKALGAQTPGKLQEQTLLKYINRSATKYPSPPGVEGAPARPARLTARGTPPEASDEKERKLHPF
jgi:hypothetical protein